MVRELQPIQRSVLTPTQTVTAGSAFAQLGESASQMGSLIAQKASQLAVDQATQRGQMDALEGVAPDELAFPLTAGTKAYNDAAAETEARRMAITAQEQIGQALLEHTNPATFTRETPASFSATLQGIVEGTLENSRPETRAALSNHLMTVASDAQLKMLQHSIDFDNQQNKLDFKHEIDQTSHLIKDAMIAGNTELVNQLKFEQDRILDNYSAMNEEIKRGAPAIREQLKQNQVINTQLSDYAHALTEGKGNEFLADFVSNKQNLPFSTWQTAAKELLAIHRTQEKLTDEVHAEAFESGVRGIKTETIQNYDDIEKIPNLTVTQTSKLMTQLDEFQAKKNKSANKIIEARKLINEGNASLIPSDTKQVIFENISDKIRAAKGGAPASVTDIALSMMGQNDFPMSGTPGVAFGTDIAAFNSMVSGRLTSGNPTLMADGAEAWNTIVKANNLPNLVSISGQSLAVAEKIAELNQGGIPPDVAAEMANKTVLQADNPEIKERRARFRKEVLPKINGWYKETFGVKPLPFGADNVMGLFKDSAEAQYAMSNSEESAKQALKYLFRQYGQDEYYPPGHVGSVKISEELPIAKVGFALYNQIRLRLQGLIKDNPEIQWATPAQDLSTASLTDDDKVFKPLGVPVRTTQELGIFAGAAAVAGQDAFRKQRPTVTINGHTSEVFLMDGPDSRLGENMRFGLFYSDQFGNLQPLPDKNNPNNMAQFQPQPLAQYAPNIVDEKNQERLNKAAIDIKKAQAKERMDQLSQGAFGFNFKAGILRPFTGQTDKFVSAAMEYIAAGDTPPEQLQDILSRLRLEPQESPAAELARADEVSVLPPVPQGAEPVEQESLQSSVAPVPELPKEKGVPKVPATTPEPETDSSFYKTMAKIESGTAGMGARSGTGSIGKFQFTKTTWNSMVNKYGKEYGIEKKDITDLHAQEIFVRLLTQENKTTMSNKLGRNPTDFELYIAHNVGPAGAAKLIKAAAATPDKTVTQSMINSNPSHNPRFYLDKDKKPVTALEAYTRYSKAFHGGK